MARNKIEELKREKDGLDVLPDLYRYAVEGVEAIPADDLERLKWYGLFHRKATPGYFMLRMRIPNGVLSSEQIAAVGEIANRCGRGTADITTRQNIQLRWITIEDAPWVLQRLAAAGLNSQQSGMDNVRNVVGCPIAGLDADELLDARGLADRLQQAIIGGKRFSNLPRKFNLSISGCREDCAHAQTHDLSFVPATREEGGREAAGFNVLVGGALGGMQPELAQPLDAFVGPEGVVPLALAILETFRDHGPREQRKQARLKVLLAQWGIERFREAVEERLGSALARAGEAGGQAARRRPHRRRRAAPAGAQRRRLPRARRARERRRSDRVRAARGRVRHGGAAADGAAERADPGRARRSPQGAARGAAAGDVQPRSPRRGCARS